MVAIYFVFLSIVSYLLTKRDEKSFTRKELLKQCLICSLSI
jgi:hypothetical protein